LTRVPPYALLSPPHTFFPPPFAPLNLLHPPSFRAPPMPPLPTLLLSLSPSSILSLISFLLSQSSLTVSESSDPWFSVLSDEYSPRPFIFYPGAPPPPWARDILFSVAQHFHPFFTFCRSLTGPSFVFPCARFCEACQRGRPLVSRAPPGRDRPSPDY